MGRLAPGAMIHEMFPVGDWGFAKGTARVLAPPLVSTMWGVDRINKDGVHVSLVGVGDDFHGIQSFFMISSSAHIQVTVSTASNLGPKGLLEGFDRTLDKPML